MQEGHSTVPRKGSVRGAGCVAGARQAITAASLGKSLQGASSKAILLLRVFEQFLPITLK